MISCTLAPIKQNNFIQPQITNHKYGQYLSNYFHIKGYGKKCWVIAVNIEINHSVYLAQGYNKETLVRECIAHLNFPPKSKYGKKRRRQPLYGKFRDEPYSFTLKVKDGKPIIQALLVTERRKSKYFWGEGRKVNYSTWRRKKQQ